MAGYIKLSLRVYSSSANILEEIDPFDQCEIWNCWPFGYTRSISLYSVLVLNFLDCLVETLAMEGSCIVQSEGVWATTYIEEGNSNDKWSFVSRQITVASTFVTGSF